MEEFGFELCSQNEIKLGEDIQKVGKCGMSVVQRGHWPDWLKVRCGSEQNGCVWLLRWEQIMVILKTKVFS